VKTIVHVNQHIIKKNAKEGSKEPVLTCKTYKSNNYGSTVIIKDDEGKEVGRFIYRPDKPLSCGAKVWFETNNEVEVLTHENN
jgi:hypothetical protein